MGAVDLDLVNCFCHFEWAAVRDGVSAITPELNRWEAWCTERPVRARCQCGVSFAAQRKISDT